MTGIIYLDGNEHTGKSTLAHELEQHHGAVILHQGYRFRDKIFTYHAAALRKAVQMSLTCLVVIDRLWMSEAIYGQVYRGGTKWPLQGRMFDRVLRRFAALHVICATDGAHAAHVVQSKPGRDLYQDQVKTVEVEEHFLGLTDGRVTLTPADKNHFFSLSGNRGDIIRYDYRHWKVEDAVQYLLKELAKLQQRYPMFELTRDPTLMNFSGVLVPGGTLVVGDKCNPKNRKVAWPFFEYGNCSLYLAKALAEEGIVEDNVGWTNAYDDRFDEVLALAVKAGVTKCVILGRRAEKKVQERLAMMRGFDTRTVRHPQSARRFDHRNLAGYGHDLKVAFS